MSYSNEQLFTEQFNSDNIGDSLRFYLAPQKENNKLFAQADGLPVVKVMHPKIGSFNAFEKLYDRPNTANATHGTRLRGNATPGVNYPESTDSDIEILKLSDDGKYLNFVLCAYTETLTSGFKFVLGEETPSTGYGNIIIDDTNVTINVLDSNGSPVTKTAAHGETLTANTFTLIGMTWKNGGLAVDNWKMHNSGTPPIDFNSTQLFSGQNIPNGSTLKIKDTFYGGVTESGGEAIGLCAAACWISGGEGDIPVQLYNWYHGMNALTNEITSA